MGVLHSAASPGQFFVFNHLKFKNRGEFQFKVVFKRAGEPIGAAFRLPRILII